MIDPNLKDKIILVSGANHGIGSAIAEDFSKQGAKVFLTYFRDDCTYSNEELEKAKKNNIPGDTLYRAKQQNSTDEIEMKISSNNGVVFSLEMDLGNIENIPNLFDLCEEKIGPIDILINNHTYCFLETFDEELSLKSEDIQMISSEEIEKHFRINSQSYALMMSEYVKRFLKRKAEWGRIVNISTDAAHSHPGNVSYAASKHAIESYSRSAAVELGKYGITINIVAPGPIQTGYIEPELEESIIEETPLRRIGQPEDVASVVTFLASEQAKWLTGQLLYVGGGWRMHQ